MTASPRPGGGTWRTTAKGYKAYLDAGKTERECVAEAIRQAKEQGFQPYERGMALAPGDKVYLSNRGKMLLLAVIGRKSLAEGAGSPPPTSTPPGWT